MTVRIIRHSELLVYFPWQLNVPKCYWQPIVLFQHNYATYSLKWWTSTTAYHSIVYVSGEPCCSSDVTRSKPRRL